jgi:hypothetical protein
MILIVRKKKNAASEDAAFVVRELDCLSGRCGRVAADGGFDDLAGLDALGADADDADAAVHEGTDALKVREEAAGRDAGRFETDTAGLLGDTAAGDLFAGQRFLIADFANSCHFGLPRGS